MIGALFLQSLILQDVGGLSVEEGIKGAGET